MLGEYKGGAAAKNRVDENNRNELIHYRGLLEADDLCSMRTIMRMRDDAIKDNQEELVQVIFALPKSKVSEFFNALVDFPEPALVRKINQLILDFKHTKP